MRTHQAGAVLLIVCCLAFAGCGGPKSVEVSGDVTYDGGKPVPAGRIYFSPDTTKGNDGPQGFAVIHDGKFDTRKNGRAPIGGPMIVRINACEAGADPSSAMVGPHLFKDYEMAIDLPKEDSTQTFDVPATAPKDPPKAPAVKGKGP